VLDNVSTRVTLNIWLLLPDVDPLPVPLELPELPDAEFPEPEFADPEPDADPAPDIPLLDPVEPLLLACWPLFEPVDPDVPLMPDPLDDAELLLESCPCTRTRCPSCDAMSDDPLNCLRCWPLSGTR